MTIALGRGWRVWKRVGRELPGGVTRCSIESERESAQSVEHVVPCDPMGSCRVSQASEDLLRFVRDRADNPRHRLERSAVRA